MQDKKQDEQDGFLFSQITEKILNSCFEVINTLGIGLLESVYKNSLQIALLENGLIVDANRPFEVIFRGRKVGVFLPDLIVEDKVIIELKACDRLLPVHQAQLINYLVIANVKVGLLVNFGERRLEYKRVHHPAYPVSHPIHPVPL